MNTNQNQQRLERKEMKIKAGGLGLLIFVLISAYLIKNKMANVGYFVVGLIVSSMAASFFAIVLDYQYDKDQIVADTSTTTSETATAIKPEKSETTAFYASQWKW